MAKINAIVKATAPSAWASYLINGDASGIEDADIEAANAWIKRQGLGSPVSCKDAGFMRNHNAFEEMPLSADCQEYIFHDTRPRLPFIIRRRFFKDLSKWELFAAFPTVAALSSEWFAFEAEADNGDSFACSEEYWNASKHVRGFNPERVAAFERRIRHAWENDSHFPCVLIRYERKARWMDDEREREWHKGRAA